jgi:hypothetical protein
MYMKRRYAHILAAAQLCLSGCIFVGDENDWASRKDIIEAAKRCGLNDFEPTKIGDAWAAYVKADRPDARHIENCIYADLERQDLLATR